MSSIILTGLCLFSAILPMAGYALDVPNLCEQIILAHPPVASTQFKFSRDTVVRNLRPEMNFPKLGSLEELKAAFLKIRDSHVVKVDVLSLQRGIFRNKLVAGNSGYAKIPWEFSENYCAQRAELSAAILADSGFPLPVMVDLVTDHQRLRRATDENEETPISHFPSLHQQDALSISGDHKKPLESAPVEWSYHVSIGYVVKGELWILDPAVAYETPIRFVDWHRRLAFGIPEVEVELKWPHADHPDEKLAHLYGQFQRQALLRFSKGKISAQEMDRLTALFNRVTGPLKTQPDAAFIQH